MLVLVECDAALIRERMARSRRSRCILRDQDVERVTDAFRREFDASLIPRKFALDAGAASTEEVFASFRRQIEPHLSDDDRRRLA